jgi:hypothetical protein
MKKLNQIFTSFVNIIGKPFYFFASLASLIGLVLSIISDTYSTIIALCTICLMLTVFTAYLIYSLFKIFEFSGEEINVRSTFVKYETSDGKKIRYESFKLIQAKRPILTQHEWGFKWSGSKLPSISSDFQEVTNVLNENDGSKYDKAILKFNKPLYFNQTTLIHFKAELDDTDLKSNTYVESKVIYEVDVIHYRVILKKKPNDYNLNAKVERKKINSEIHLEYQEVDQIAFDAQTKSYEHMIIRPEIGYYYRLSWER